MNSANAGTSRIGGERRKNSSSPIPQVSHKGAATVIATWCGAENSKLSRDLVTHCTTKVEYGQNLYVVNFQASGTRAAEARACFRRGALRNCGRAFPRL